MMEPMDDRAAAFESQRRRLFGIAYRMLGSAAEAEDAVQEAWLRFAGAAAGIDSPPAWLAQVVTRICLDQLKSARARRESYVGPWLPEPLRTDGSGDGVDPDSISVAFLLLLESLSPLERAVYLLHEVFDYRHAEVAAIVGRDEATCRQLLHRAREAVRERRPRFRPSREAHQRLLSGFLGAIASGDVAGLRALLTDDVRSLSDGGGKVQAARRVVEGKDEVARMLVGLYKKADPKMPLSVDPIEVNGWPAVLVSAHGRPFEVLTIETDGERIVAVYMQLNPDKLGAFTAA
jgi:RNA polymerase sigma-70 factor (ECF subfamily)